MTRDAKGACGAAQLTPVRFPADLAVADVNRTNLREWTRLPCAKPLVGPQQASLKALALSLGGRAARLAPSQIHKYDAVLLCCFFSARRGRRYGSQNLLRD
jgi:hypothetical protein